MSVDTVTQPTSDWLLFDMTSGYNLNIVDAIAASDNLLPTASASYTLRAAYGLTGSMWGEEGYFYDEFEVNVVDH